MLKKILIIEDDSELCQELSEILKDEGYFVESAPDVPEGKAMLIKNKFDAVILDYKMASSTGIEIIKFIKEKKLKPKIFVMSGKPFIEKLIKEEGLSGLVSRIIPKPFSINTLLKSIKSS